GHEVVGFVGGITEHHSLISRTLVFFVLTLDALVDVGRLLVYSREYAATVCFEHIFTSGISYSAYYFTGDVLDVKVRLRFYFAGQNDLPCCDQGLARYLRIRVVSKEVVDKCIGYLIRYLIRMSFGNGLRCKQVWHKDLAEFIITQ